VGGLFSFTASHVFAGFRRSNKYLHAAGKLVLAGRASRTNAACRQDRPIACRLAIGLTGRNRRESRLAGVEADAALGDTRHTLRRGRDLHQRPQDRRCQEIAHVPPCLIGPCIHAASLTDPSIDLNALARHEHALVGRQKQRQTRDVFRRHRIGDGLARAEFGDRLLVRIP